MIPGFNHSGVIPPYLGADPASGGSGLMSPYPIGLDEFVGAFGTSSERKAILNGFLQYRNDLRSLGIQGWQWLDGSFLEDCEKHRCAPPKDLDLLTIVTGWPTGVTNPQQLQQLVNAKPELFYPAPMKSKYYCDGYFVHCVFGPYFTVKQASYWLGLFSHQRLTSLWKGVLEVPLQLSDNDSSAQDVLRNLG